MMYTSVQLEPNWFNTYWVRQACTILQDKYLASQFGQAIQTCTSCVHMHIYIYVLYVYAVYISLEMYTHIHIYIHVQMPQFWFVCSMCQTYWAHVFLIGCAWHLAQACSQLGSNVRLPTLLTTLVALLPALAHSVVFMCARLSCACASAL